ncbi:MAG: magnesium chelatase, partial [Pseudomonadota bacterium]
MLRHGGLALAKALLAGWCDQLNRRGDPLVVISFGGDDAQLLKAPETGARIREWIDRIPGGGGTPLSSGIQLVDRTVRRLRS